jgi:putative oxidoreductase
MTILRVTIAIIFIAHASQKLFSDGIDAVAKAFAQLGVPLPTVSTVAISGLEFVGGLLLLIGLLARPTAALLAFDMLGAVYFVAHANRGFFSKGGGYEYPLTLLAASLALALAGPGAAAVDNLVRSRR